MWPSKTSIGAAVALSAASVSAYLTDDGQVVIPGASSYNGMALTPPMGWDNWNAFACNVNESLLLNTASAMVKYGLKDLGYDHVVLDDCWSIGRNSSGYLVHDPTKFPNGMLSVADRLHAMGMKFGMYSSAGVFTCGRYPGSLGNEDKDAEYFAANGVDYLKYDNCYNQGQYGTAKLSFDRYNTMSMALNKTGRPITYALCNWGQDQVWAWATEMSNAARMSGDVYDSFNRPDDACPYDENPNPWPGYHCSAMNIINKMAPIASKTQPGFFSDMDMLEVGNGGMSDAEYVTHMSMWALMSSPLLMGTDVTLLSPANLAIYANPAVVALNQDPSGTSASRIWRRTCDDKDVNGQCETQLWSRPLDNGDMAVALINGANSSMRMSASLADIFLEQRLSGTSKPLPQLSMAWDVHDLWKNRMSDGEAMSLIAGNASMVAANSTTRYNATATSFADGIKMNATALMGAKVSTLAPSGTLSADVASHSIGLFRLRPQAQTGMTKRLEL